MYLKYVLQKPGGLIVILRDGFNGFANNLIIKRYNRGDGVQQEKICVQLAEIAYLDAQTLFYTILSE